MNLTVLDLEILMECVRVTRATLDNRVNDSVAVKTASLEKLDQIYSSLKEEKEEKERLSMLGLLLV